MANKFNGNLHLSLYIIEFLYSDSTHSFSFQRKNWMGLSSIGDGVGCYCFFNIEFLFFVDSIIHWQLSTDTPRSYSIRIYPSHFCPHYYYCFAYASQDTLFIDECRVSRAECIYECVWSDRKTFLARARELTRYPRQD